MDFETRTAQETAQILHTDLEKGLTEEEARSRLMRQGKNELQGQKKPPGVVKRFFAQLNDALVLLLLAAAGVSFLVSMVEGKGELWDSAVIIAIVLVNAIIGVAQEQKAQKAMQALQALNAPFARVKRNGQVRRILAEEVVVGDLLLLETGDRVAADGRLVESTSLRTQEAAITGEAAEVEKEAEVICQAHTPVAERMNLVLSSSFVAYGRGIAIVTATGMDTQVGHIARLLEGEEEKKTPLQKRLDETGKYLAGGALLICGLIFVLGLLRGGNLFSLFMTAVSLAVAAIPEGLTAVVTIVLAMGTGRLAKKQAIIRHLTAVETLGSATVICSDKTGTLTQNKMTLTMLRTGGGQVPSATQTEELYFLGLNCNHALLQNQSFVGMATEVALAEGAWKAGVRERMTTVDEIPFSSKRKRMTTVHQIGGRYLAITKGAPEVLLPLTAKMEEGRREIPFTGQAKEEAMKTVEEMAKRALRVIALCKKEFDHQPTSQELERELVLVGFVGMMDPPRPEARSAVLQCRKAGIRPVMITGDNAQTAVAIAREVGIYTEKDGCLTGLQIERMTAEELQQAVGKTAVYARVSPEHKVRIVKAYQALGETVAMTGDGVNDAPALKAADIGCAMGKTGTDAAKNAADLVIADDNFATIVAAVKEGRGLFQNIKKTVHFLLSSNIGEIVTIFFAMVLDLPTPLLPIQLLWVNLLTDSLPAIALGLDGVDPDTMQGRGGSRSVIGREDAMRIGLEGALIGVLSLTAFGLGRQMGDLATGRTMAFSVLALSQLVHAFNMRSPHSVLNRHMFQNRWLDASFLLGTALQVFVVMLPGAQAVFGVTALTAIQWGLVAVLMSVPLAAVELEKRFCHEMASRSSGKNRKRQMVAK